MKTWREALRAGDPIASEPGLDLETTRRMRATVLMARQAPVARAFALPMALAVVLSAVIVTGVVTTRRAPTDAPQVVMAPVGASDVRQLQFATSGGTRVIWVFNSAFDVREGE